MLTFLYYHRRPSLSYSRILRRGLAIISRGCCSTTAGDCGDGLQIRGSFDNDKPLPAYRPSEDLRFESTLSRF